MNTSRILATLLFVCCLSMPYEANAQFLKKLGKALDKVDKALGSTSSETSQSGQAQEQKTSSTGKGGQLHMATYGTENAKPSMLHRTSQTKLITVDNLPSITEFSDGAAYVSEGGGKNGYYIDTLGNKLFDFISGYQSAPKFNKGAMIYKGRTDAFILNKKGETISKIPNVLTVTDFTKDGIAAITVGAPSQKVRGMLDHYNIFINTEGKPLFESLVFSPTLDGLKPARLLKNGLAAFYNYQQRKWGYRDATGKIVIPAQFTEAKDFSDGLALVKADAGGAPKWGYINTTGTFVIQPIYTKEPGSFNSGYAPVRDKEGKVFYIDKTGKIVTKALESGTAFHNGYAIVRDEYLYIMSAELKYVAVFENHYFQIPYQNFEDNNTDADLQWNGNDIYIKGSLVTPYGDILISYVSGFFEGNYAPCYMASFRAADKQVHSGFVNRKGEYIVEFVESQF